MVSATVERRKKLLEVSESRAAADLSNVVYQRDLSVSHEKLRRLTAVDENDTT